MEACPSLPFGHGLLSFEGGSIFVQLCGERLKVNTYNLLTNHTSPRSKGKGGGGGEGRSESTYASGKEAIHKCTGRRLCRGAYG